MSEKYKVIDSSLPTFVTFSLVGWVDLFVRRIYTDILDDSLNHCCKEKGLVIHAYVYMTSHIHLIVSSRDQEINNVVRDFKKFTSKRLVEAVDDINESRREWLLNKFAFEARRIGRASKYKVWQDGFHPVLLDTNKKRSDRLNYIHYNPIDSGFVKHERDWVNSSYLAYEDGTDQPNLCVNPLW